MNKEELKKELEWYETYPVIFLMWLGLVTIPLAMWSITKRVEKMNRFYEKKKVSGEYREIIDQANEEARLIKKKSEEELLREAKEIQAYKEEIARTIDQANEEAMLLKKTTEEELLREAKEIQAYKEEIARTVEKKDKVEELNNTLVSLQREHEKAEKQTTTAVNKLKKVKTEFEGVSHLIKSMPTLIQSENIKNEILQYTRTFRETGVIDNAIELDLHYMDSKELRKEMTAKKKEFKNLLDRYTGMADTGSDKAVYEAIKLSVQSELQNILFALKMGKLEEGKEAVRGLTDKYLVIGADTSKETATTLTRFLFEIEPLFLSMVDIEYKYYRRREQELEEQRELREQMKQEAEEKKLLEEQKKKLEKEEEKYAVEILRNQQQLEQEQDEDKLKALQERIAELENQKTGLQEKKEEVTRLANGKAGYVYIISNKGSFGENVFKVGMTRRQEPMDRVKELSSASVPFGFDVHGLIFSKDAVGLENELHERLNANRVNKVNTRKEFFRVDMDTLQGLVEEIDGTAEFRRTVVAEDYVETLRLERELAEVN